MVTMETRNFTQEEWRVVVSQFEDLSLIQTWEYGQAKVLLGGWRVVRHVWYNGDVVVGAAQAMVKTMPFFEKGLVWINRAPLWQKKNAQHDANLFREILEMLVRYWAKERGMYLRIAPSVNDNEDYRAFVRNAGLCERKNSQWASVILDITKSADILRAGLDKKWRNCLAKAEKSGLTCSTGTDVVYMEELIRDYRGLLDRKQFSSVTPEFILHLQQTLPEDRKMLVLCARKGNQKLGSILIACYGDTAEYLVGAVGHEGRVENVGQFLLWRAILAMRQAGIKHFDLGGVHPEKTPKGILHFKQGMGGTPYRLVGEFDAAGGLIARGIKLMVQYRS